MAIIAYGQGTPSLSSKANLWVTVADTSNAVAEFSKAFYTLEVEESHQPGDTVLKLYAEKDFKFALLNTDGINVFDVDTSTGYIQLVKALGSVQHRVTIDYSLRHQLTLTHRSLTLQKLAPKRWLFEFFTGGENTHKPVFYSIVGLFVMEADTGRLTVTASLDREKRGRYIYSLKVRAENVGRHRFERKISRS
ncbi:cadherin-89D, partial [Trichonephila inaurata madagascariensis]